MGLKMYVWVMENTLRKLSVNANGRIYANKGNTYTLGALNNE